MNDHREAFERDLKARLAVDPSSDLQARIRARAFSAPAKRTPPFREWFGWTSGLAAAAAAIILLAVFIQPKSPESIAPPLNVAVDPPVAPSPEPAPVPTAPVRVASRPVKAPAPVSTKQPVLIQIPATAGLNPGQIEVRPLTGLELTNALAPLPQTPALSIASIQLNNIEPLSLAVQNLGVNE
jgi:hypothetical protein